MSFLNTNYSATIAARLTQKGRNAISKGNFNISYFAIGDSEYNYHNPDTQSVLTPFDKDINIKYPLWYTSDSTYFGIPINNSITSTCRNVMTDTGWKSNVVWETNPIGFSGATPSDFSGFTNGKYLGTKSFFGYSSSSGQTTNTGTTITDTLGSKITISPEEQKAIAIIQYNGTPTLDDFFKYDDYISTYTGITSPNTNTDEQYFSVTLPSLDYHRSTNNTFTMGTNGSVVSNVNGRLTIDYRYLVDYVGNNVGKIFFNHKLIIFDDEEIAISLDPAANRTYTLPAPFVSTLVTNNDYLTELTTGKTLWITYTLDTTTLPCNYFMKVTGSTNNEVVTIKFSGSSFNYLNNGYTASQLKLLYQFTNGSAPNYSSWKMIDLLSELSSVDDLKTGHTFTLTQTKIANFTSYSSSLANFGNTGTTFGTVNLVRASDIEEMTYNLSLPINKFTISQNPTFANGSTTTITEVALLNNNKETLVMGKLSKPIQRTGAQVFSVKLDF